MATINESNPGTAPDTPALPSLEELQHWTSVMGRAQQLMLEHVAQQMNESVTAAPAMFDPGKAAVQWPGMEMWADPAKLAQMQTELWTEGLNIWQRALGPGAGRAEERASGESRQGQALRRARMGRAPDVRHDAPDLSARLRTHARVGRHAGGAGRQAEAESCASRPSSSLTPWRRPTSP
jgi:hypothetical protein